MLKSKSITVREYTPKDRPQVEYVAKRAFNGSMDSYWATRYIDRCDKAFVATINDKIVGVAELGVKRFKSGLYAQIGYIFVDPDHRKRGVGTKLLEASLEYLKSIGVDAAWALTDKDNIATRRLFKKMGFQEFKSPKELRGILSRRERFSLLRWMIYWVGDVILYKPLQSK